MVDNLKQHCLWLAFALACCLVSPAQAKEFPGLSPIEKQKANYLFNFTRFIHWPAESGRFAHTDITLCVHHLPVFREFLSYVARDRLVGAKRLPVKVVPYNADSRCDLAYLNDLGVANSANLQQVLLVSELGQGLVQPTISFYQDGNQLGFEVDVEQLSSLELVISSELLKLARIKPDARR